MATVTGLTAARMLLIEAASVVSGVITGDSLILTKHDGTTINAGNVRGPKGDVGPTGSISSSPAGGDLTGNYPNPSVANKDADASIPSMRTLGSNALQAAPGNHVHNVDTGWVDFSSHVANGDVPFAGKVVNLARYRKIGRLCHVQIERTSTASRDNSGNTTGDLPNITILGVGSVPTTACPVGNPVQGSARIADSVSGLCIQANGSVVWYGGFPRVYDVGSDLQADFLFFTDN